MKFLQILEKAWLSAIVIAFGLGIYNAINLGNFSYHVYTPLVCGGFSILIYINIRRQRLFLEKMKQEQKDAPRPSPKEGA
jgi:hypothetical protein